MGHWGPGKISRGGVCERLGKALTACVLVGTVIGIVACGSSSKWLAGQLYAYTVGQLTGWKTERGQGSAVDTSAIMAPTAHNLTRSQIEAVAAYVSYLP